MALVIESRYIVKVSRTHPTILSILDMDTDALIELPLRGSCAMKLAQSLRQAYVESPHRGKLAGDDGPKQKP